MAIYLVAIHRKFSLNLLQLLVGQADCIVDSVTFEQRFRLR
jgi:hypothetical protein